MPEQITFEGLATMDTLTGIDEFTVMVIALEVAGDPVAHSALEVSTQVITFPFVSVVVVYVLDVAPPMFTPFFFHW